tara:strand:- start:174 stop:437 length:264 start_codon:yes stop_codon:yes gene_type:complete
MTIENLFQRLQISLSSEEYEHADLILSKLSRYSDKFDDTQIEEYDYAQRIVEIELHGISDYDDGDNDLFDWDGDALASAGFGVDEDY